MKVAKNVLIAVKVSVKMQDQYLIRLDNGNCIEVLYGSGKYRLDFIKNKDGLIQQYMSNTLTKREFDEIIKGMLAVRK